jgi:phospholipase C
MPSPIQHVFVLMMENRSFDHLFAFADVPGLDGVDTSLTNPMLASDVPMSAAAPDIMNSDPHHEFPDVDQQIFGPAAGPPNTARPITMQGFASSSGADAMLCGSTISAPTLIFLAQNYLVCDNWFSSMPGPTWPNRFFVHAASSGGLESSPSNLTMTGALTDSDLGFSFENGTIYDRLGAGNWRVYHGDHFPQVCAINTMPLAFVAGADKFRPFSQFASDLQRNDAVAYTFIEPDYDILSSFVNGNSQHPCGSLLRGDQLITNVYDALRMSPSLWERSMLIVVYDEHGGFFDHIHPPGCTPPGDAPLNEDKAATHPTGFPFDRYGVRVPAVIVSPWVAPGTVSHVTYDHSSIIRTLFDVFSLSGSSLTGRDRVAASLTALLQNTIQFPTPPPVPQFNVATPQATTAPVATASDVSVAGFTRIAAQVHHALLSFQANQNPTVLRSEAFAKLDLKSLPGIPLSGNRNDSLTYIGQVADLMRTHRLMQGAKPVK